MTVWKDARELGKSAAEIAIQLANGKKLEEVAGAVKWNEGPNKAQMSAIFLKPVAVTRDNLNVVIEAGWAPKAAVCQGVPAGRSRPATERIDRSSRTACCAILCSRSRSAAALWCRFSSDLAMPSGDCHGPLRKLRSMPG